MLAGSAVAITWTRSSFAVTTRELAPDTVQPVSSSTGVVVVEAQVMIELEGEVALASS